MLEQRCWWLLALLIVEISNANEFDNGLLGTPEVLCKTDTIEMAFQTKKPFRGKVFVKGHYSNPECRVDYSKTDSNGQPIDGIKLSHGQCDMDRQRTVHPDGMQFSTILVISFHPLFITKVDRAFHVKCLYKEAATRISSNLEVSALPTESITYTVPIPMCTYTIRKDEIDGPILTYARVGDQVVHRWECNSDIYGILVHSCYVEDGQGEKQLIIDENGCHKDKTLLGGPTYVKALNMAYREAFVFKFADRVVVRFQCEIRLCLKDDHGCDAITPPICTEFDNSDANTASPNGFNSDQQNIQEVDSYHRRSIRNTQNITQPTIETDLISQSIYVLDANDNDFNGNERQLAEDDGSKTGKVCIETVTFAVLISTLAIMFVAATITTFYTLIKWYRFTDKLSDGFSSTSSYSYSTSKFPSKF